MEKFLRIISKNGNKYFLIEIVSFKAGYIYFQRHSSSIRWHFSIKVPLKQNNFAQFAINILTICTLIVSWFATINVTAILTISLFLSPFVSLISILEFHIAIKNMQSCSLIWFTPYFFNSNRFAYHWRIILENKN